MTGHTGMKCFVKSKIKPPAGICEVVIIIIFYRTINKHYYDIINIILRSILGHVLSMCII